MNDAECTALSDTPLELLCYDAAKFQRIRMISCSTCGKQLEGNTYCTHCGALPLDREARKANPWLSFLLAVVLAVLIGVGMVLRDSETRPSPRVQPGPQPQAQDDLTRVIATCGKPDTDKTATVKRKAAATATRTLVYKKRSVKLIFVQTPAAGSQYWSLESARSVKSDQVMRREQLAKQMPCLEDQSKQHR